MGAEDAGWPPTCLGRGKTSFSRGCPHASELLDLAPPVAAPVRAKLKAESPIGERRSWGLGARRTHRGHHTNSHRQCPMAPTSLGECGRGRSKFFSTLWPEERGPPESLERDARRLSQYLKLREAVDSMEIPQALSHWILPCWLPSCFLNPDGIRELGLLAVHSSAAPHPWPAGHEMLLSSRKESSLGQSESQTTPPQRRGPDPTAQADFGVDGKTRGALKNSQPPGLAKSKDTYPKKVF